MQGILHLYKRINRFWLMLGLTVALLTLAIVPSVLPAQAQSQRVSYTAFQEYERGYTIWESDTGAIWSLYNDGTYHYYSLLNYANMPDNPVTDPTPQGRVRPINGFGRVWGNFLGVRDRLGWAIAPEVGYTATYQLVDVPVPNNPPYTLQEQRFTFPDERWVGIVAGGWSFIPYPPPPMPATPTYTPPPASPTPPPNIPNVQIIPATMQNYQNGFMMWWSTNGSILVFDYNGTVQRFPVSNYGPLPDNPYTLTPPWGFTRSIMGFGKVWGNYANVRHRLGWATGGEYSNRLEYEQLRTQGGSGNVFALRISPTGIIIIRDFATWSYG